MGTIEGCDSTPSVMIYKPPHALGTLHNRMMGAGRGGADRGGPEITSSHP